MNQRDAHRETPSHDLTGYPPGVPYIIGNEGCERFSFYGMKAILYIYIAGLYINMRELDGAAGKMAATQTMHLFVAAVYFVPLVGGIIADRLLGKYRTILSLSVVYCIGHLALAIFEDPSYQQSLLGQVLVDPITGLYIGLGLIALGSGGIKPCVSAHVGDQFGKKNWHLLQNIFNAFYFIINFGSAFATLLVPWIRGSLIEDPITGHISYTGSVGWAFGIPGILMGLATIFFWRGRKVFIHVPPKVGGKLGLLDVLSGTALFSVIGWPIFFGELTSTSETLRELASTAGISAEVASTAVNLGISVVAFIAFVALFSYRQRLEQDDGFLAVLFYAAKTKLLGGGEMPPKSDERDDPSNSPFWGPAVSKFGKEAAEGPPAVIKIISVFIMVSVFWALFDQHSSTWIEQARAMNRTLSMSQVQWVGLGALLGAIVGGAFLLTLAKSSRGRALWLAGGIASGVLLGVGADQLWGDQLELSASQIPALNPFMVMVLIPYTNFGLYPLMKKLGVEPHPLRRMTLGMFMASLSFVAVAMIQQWIDAEGEGAVHIVWQIIPYLVITLSEVMVSITGLEFAYSQSPKSMKSVIMGFWLFNVTLGSLLVVLLAGFEGMSPASFFWVFAGLMALAAVIFGVRAKFYRYRDFTQ